jgi:hypothetical protein
MNDLPKSKNDAIKVGSKYYFSGRPCLNGHLFKRTLGGNCVMCHRLRNAVHRDPEKRKKYYLENKPQENSNSKRYYRENREKRRAAGREHRKLNIESIRQKCSEWRHNNPGYAADHRKANKDRYLVYAENRRCRLETGKLSQDIIARLIDMQRSKCAICGKHLRGRFHLDHITPLSAGGLNIDSNVQLTHPTCNYRKGRQLPEEFMRTLGRLL